jgi:hypothetical protein
MFPCGTTSLFLSWLTGPDTVIAVLLDTPASRFLLRGRDFGILQGGNPVPIETAKIRLIVRHHQHLHFFYSKN